MQDYRDEIKDFFGVDKQLASELEYDMKKYNEQLTQEQELAKQDVADGTVGAPTAQVDEPQTTPPVWSCLRAHPQHLLSLGLFLWGTVAPLQKQCAHFPEKSRQLVRHDKDKLT